MAILMFQPFGVKASFGKPHELHGTLHTAVTSHIGILVMTVNAPYSSALLPSYLHQLLKHH